MNVSEAVERRISVRAYTDQPVAGAVVAEILERAARAPSGGNLQPWRVYALAGEPLKALAADVAKNPMGEPMEYDVYPPNLWDPFRTRRFENGEQLYASISVPREDKAARLRWFARNAEFFGAPVGLFFCLDRKLGPPQWADLGMYMQTVMLLAVERGLDTCAQEFWARYPLTVARHCGLPEDHMVFSGMALGYRDEAHPINAWRSTRDRMDTWCELKGFE
ncbi:nitroreductase [Phenylobacterium kunshanense]|uniref:Nitroreductase n=1 Tax=Phenylobacterium kunshanense TaxID=1445034 RepID=A0A328BK75_9CAUL|nr:nitroreductase [Phenylobacterium kunshanense]RAK67543.1 nitroreductase [Phenylobacterium kunshanense]